MIGFLAVAALLTVTPGADMALVTRTVLQGGRRAAFATTLGICLGCAVHALASSLGLSVILSRSPDLFRGVQALGAAYLLWLGGRALREARAGGVVASGATGKSAGDPTLGSLTWRRAFVDGLVTNVLNPKVAAFYLTFLPQFVPAGAPPLSYCLMLSGLHIATGFLWLVCYASALERLQAALAGGSVRRRLQQLTGIALIGLGLRLALADR